MQDATWRDIVSLGNEEVNAKRIKSLTATVCPCRFLQKIDFMGPFSNPGPSPCNSHDVTSTCDVTRFDNICNFLAISATANVRQAKFVVWVTEC